MVLEVIGLFLMKYFSQNQVTWMWGCVHHCAFVYFCSSVLLCELFCSSIFFRSVNASSIFLDFMAARNHNARVTEFILIGLTDDPALQVALFLLFLIIYIITLVGNLGMIVLIRISRRLHTPCTFSLVTCPSWMPVVRQWWHPRPWQSLLRREKPSLLLAVQHKCTFL